jgi:hypothetical protein
LTKADSEPTALEIYVGNFAGASYGVWWDGARLVYESFVAGYNEREEIALQPSQAAWDRFWRTLESAGVWDWAKRYEPAARLERADEIRDGTHWSLTIAHGERAVESSGDSAGPGAPDLDVSRRFTALTEAVSRLAGGRPFG